MYTMHSLGAEVNDVDHYYLPRSDQDKLVAILGTIPSLVEDLAVTLCKQDRISQSGPRISTGKNAQPLPYSPEASEAADLLHDTLAAWVKVVCDQRALEAPGHNDTKSLARWLHRWHIALAMTEGAQESFNEIAYAVGVARRAVDRPQDNSRVLVGYCATCCIYVWGRTGSAKTCHACAGELSMEQVRAHIDRSVSRMVLPAKDVAVVITTRYGTAIKPKSIYDMAYRRKNPITTVELPDGTTGFDVQNVVDDLKRRGKIA